MRITYVDYDGLQTYGDTYSLDVYAETDDGKSYSGRLVVSQWDNTYIRWEKETPPKPVEYAVEMLWFDCGEIQTECRCDVDLELANEYMEEGGEEVTAD